MEIQQLKEYLKLYWNHWPVCAVYSACLDLATKQVQSSTRRIAPTLRLVLRNAVV